MKLIRATATDRDHRGSMLFQDATEGLEAVFFEHRVCYRRGPIDFRRLARFRSTWVIDADTEAVELAMSDEEMAVFRDDPLAWLLEQRL